MVDVPLVPCQSDRGRGKFPFSQEHRRIPKSVCRFTHWKLSNIERCHDFNFRQFLVIDAVVQRGPLKARCRNQFLCVRNILARSCQNPDLACALRPQPAALELVAPVCSLHTDSGIVSSLILKNCGEYGCSMSERKHHSARLSSKHEFV